MAGGMWYHNVHSSWGYMPILRRFIILCGVLSIYIVGQICGIPKRLFYFKGVSIRPRTLETRAHPTYGIVYMTSPPSAAVVRRLIKMFSY